MPTYILKCDPDVDLYVKWSTVVDNATDVGTRKEFLDDGVDIERLDRADLKGSSVKGFAYEGDGYNPGAWDDEQLIVANCTTTNDFRWLPRKNLLAYAQALLEEDYEKAESEPITTKLEEED